MTKLQILDQVLLASAREQETSAPQLSNWIKRTIRSDLTEAEKAEALRIGRIEFASAGATRKR